MFFLCAYITIAALVMSKTSADRGESDSTSSESSYQPQDFLVPLFSGIAWPIYLVTGASYRHGFKRGKKAQALNAKNEKLLLALQPHMDEVEALLAAHR